MFSRIATILRGVAPDLQRLDPLKRLASLPSQNGFLLVQAVFLLLLVAAAVYREIADNLDSFLELPWMATRSAAARVSGAFATLLWRASGVFLAIGAVDLIWNRRRYTRQLRRSKQEVREEVKEQESSPHVKMRIRRIQRDLARRQMMKQIPSATGLSSTRRTMRRDSVRHGRAGRPARGGQGQKLPRPAHPAARFGAPGADRRESPSLAPCMYLLKSARRFPPISAAR